MLSAARCGGMLAAWHAVHWYVNVLLECRLVTVDEVSIEKLPTVLVHASGGVLHTLSVRVAWSVEARILISSWVGLLLKAKGIFNGSVKCLLMCLLGG